MTLMKVYKHIFEELKEYHSMYDKADKDYKQEDVEKKHVKQ